MDPLIALSIAGIALGAIGVLICAIWAHWGHDDLLP